MRKIEEKMRKKKLGEKWQKVAVVSKAKGAVPGGCRVSSTARRRLYFPANSTHNKRPFYPHNNLTAFPNSKTGPKV